MPQLRFLGKGAAFYPAFGNTNAFFEAGEDLFFLDFGEAAFEKAVRLLDLRRYRQVYVLLTHLHADHAGSLPSLCSYTHMVLGITIHIVHPSRSVLDFLRVTGIDERFYRWSETLPQEAPVQARAIPVQHARDMACYGYCITDKAETIYFSGDAADVPPEVLEGYLAGRIARLYQDTASHESASHCWMQRLCAHIPEDRRSGVYCMHLDGDYREALRALGFSVVASVDEG